jgi:predicted PurR-regulated permease PerM
VTTALIFTGVIILCAGVGWFTAWLERRGMSQSRTWVALLALCTLLGLIGYGLAEVLA